MSYYYWPKIDTQIRFNPQEHFDIKDEKYLIQANVKDCSFADLVDFPFIDTSIGCIIALCSHEDFNNTHCKNDIIIAKNNQSFHSITFESVKAQSPLIHQTFGLSGQAIVELGHALKVEHGIENHSYVRCCPEIILSLSNDIQDELLALSTHDLDLIALEWQKHVFNFYEEEITPYGELGWLTSYELAHYTLDYFKENIYTIYELLRSSEPNERLYFSIDE